MPRPARKRLSPWIESLIQSYGGEERCSGQLKAHVIGVGQMSQSQAQNIEGPTGLLFLSDEVLQIPAVLTASAWEHLQEQEDRECYTSLLNTTVCIQDYRLQFHMSLEQTKCRFFLSVGELVTTAAGPVKENTPCCTTLPSIKLKICKTWKTLLGQEELDSQNSQDGFDLSELLGEWQHDCLQTVLEDVRERLMMIARKRPSSPQPSTSTCKPPPTLPNAHATSWDVDRVKYKGVERFSVPVKCLLIPEEDRSGLLAASDENNQPSVDDADWRIAEPAVVERERRTDENFPPPEEDSMLHEDTVTRMIGNDIRPLSNPWDMFSPPGDICSSSDASLETTPIEPPRSPAIANSTPEHPVILTSTQPSVHSSKESQHSKREHSFFPPYQKQPPAATCSSTSVSADQWNLSPAANEHRTHTTQPDIPTLDQENQILDMYEETIERRYKKAKKRRSEPTPEVLTILREEEEVQISGSPPSWLFDTQTDSRVKDSSSDSSGGSSSGGSGSSSGSSSSGNLQGKPVGTSSRKTPTAHSDGRPFSYSYQVSGQNLQDFSRVKVSESLLHWAVKYLVHTTRR